MSENNAIFDGLDAINWSRLHHAYGYARDTPDAIRALLSDDPQIRDDALDQLYGSILHQGTIYEALSYAIPFLLRIVQLPNAPNRQKVFSFLGSILDEYDYLLSDNEVLQNELSSDDQLHNRASPGFRAVLLSTRAALLAGCPHYVTLLEDSDPDIQQTAANLLAELHEKLPETEPIFRRALADTTNPKQKSILITALATLWVKHDGETSIGHKPLTGADQQFLMGFMRNPHEAPDVRFAAAMEAVRLWGEAVIDEAMPMMFQGLAFISGKTMKVDPEAHGLLNQFSAALIAIGSQAIPGKRSQIIGQSTVSNPDSRWKMLLHAYNYVRSNLSNPQPRAALTWYIASSHAEDSRLRTEAAGQMKYLAEAWRWVPPLVAPRLIEMLNDTNPLVQFQAAESLFELGTTAEAFLTDATLTQTGKSKRTILAILKRIRAHKPVFAPRRSDPLPLNESVTRLVAMLKSRLAANDNQAKPSLTQIIFTVGQQGAAAQSAIPELRTALQGRDDWIRVAAARALYRISRDPNDLKHAASALRGIVTTGANNTPKLDAARFLAQVVPEEIPLIVEKLREWLIADRFFRDGVCNLLWELDPTQADFLIENLLAQSQNTRFTNYTLTVYDLNLLSAMGPAAHAAVPAIRQIVESERRVYHWGSGFETIAGDEALLQAARQALARIG